MDIVLIGLLLLAAGVGGWLLTAPSREAVAKRRITELGNTGRRRQEEIAAYYINVIERAERRLDERRIR